MLTSMFYYNYYKPYMVKNVSRTAAATSLAETSSTPVAENLDTSQHKAVLLNKALKGDVVSYARDLSKNITGLKDSAKHLIRLEERFDRNIRAEGRTEMAEWVAEDVESFVESYNSNRTFSLTQVHSGNLVTFASELGKYVTENKDALASMGVTMKEDGTLSFDGAKEKIEKSSGSALKGMLTKGSEMFQTVYDRTSDMLKHPLSDHMNFKGLRYYYSYQMGSVKDDTFKIIEAGMIVDIAV